MSHISAPYRFVPLSRLILLPDWADQISHDHPFEDGVSGELQLTLTCHTPLCVGGEQTKASPGQPGKVHFFRSPDNQPAIPGSSLKGMLRNVVEIASFGRFKQVEDQRLGVRDITKSDNFYVKAVVNPPPQAGWLRFENGQWHIHPSQYCRLHQRDLIKHCGISEREWIDKRASKAAYRYQLLEKKVGLLSSIQFDTQPGKFGRIMAAPNGQGQYQGRIVVTGQPGNAFNDEQPGRPNKNKKYEFIFYSKSEDGGAAVPVLDEVMRSFQHIHQDSDEWKYWRSLLNQNKLDSGIPVFFHQDKDGSIRSLGLAMMYKVPYKHSLHQAIAHTAKEHLQVETPDLADTIFGCIDQQPGKSLRGRVSISLAHLIDAESTHLHEVGPTVLSNPKPTFYPAYIRQGDAKDFRQLMQADSELAGWKRYPPKSVQVPPPPDKSQPTVQVTLETVAAKSRFAFKLRFHNLRRVELGALLWALDFGGQPRLRHGLGMGKPFGLGQISLQLDGCELLPNNPDDTVGTAATDLASSLLWLKAYRQEFTEFMQQALTDAGQPSWLQSGPMQALLAYCNADKPLADLANLSQPKDFAKLKTPEHLGEIIQTFHTYEGVKLAAGAPNTSTRGSSHDFQSLLQSAQAEIQRAHVAQQREDDMRSAAPHMAAATELKFQLAEYDDGKRTGSLIDNIAGNLNKANEQWAAMDQTEQMQLMELVARCQVIENKKVQKACKKYMR